MKCVKNLEICDHRTWHHLGEREERRVVGHIAGSEEQRSLLLMQIGKLRLQLFMVGRVTRDVPRTTSAHPMLVQGGAAQ